MREGIKRRTLRSKTNRLRESKSSEKSSRIELIARMNPGSIKQRNSSISHTGWNKLLRGTINLLTDKKKRKSMGTIQSSKMLRNSKKSISSQKRKKPTTKKSKGKWICSHKNSSKGSHSRWTQSSEETSKINLMSLGTLRSLSRPREPQRERIFSRRTLLKNTRERSS